jgi:hypothetical protein
LSVGLFRPRIDSEIRAVFRRTSRESPLLGAPRIHGKLLMLGIEVAASTVGRSMVRCRRPPSQGWKTFLCNHAAGIASLDPIRPPTISFKLLYGLVILSHARRRLVTISVTASPTAQWIAGKVTDSFPWDEAPRYLLRDRDAAFGPAYTHRIRVNEDPRSSDRARTRHGRTATSSACSARFDAKASIPDRVRRNAVAARSEELRCSFQSGPDASLTGPECAGFRRPQKLGPIASISILGGLHHRYVRA